MEHRCAVIVPLLLALELATSVHAAIPDRDFSGKWALDQVASRIRAFPEVETTIAIAQDDRSIVYSAPNIQRRYALDGSETRTRIGAESWNSATKWEGTALLVNSLVSGPQDYTVMERWVLTRDHNTLTITRQIQRAGAEQEGALIFRREDKRAAADADLPSANSRVESPPAFAKRSEPGIAPDITVPSGTRILLSLIGEVSTKHAKEGDRVYLRTAVPVAADGRVVIPRESDVAGTINRTKPAGKIAGKGELFLRFDSLILPNGISRDFHARPPGSEGQVEGNGKSADGRAVMAGAGMGATIGAITRGLPGAGVGGAAGALAGVLLSRNQNIVLRSGTHLEMVLDRDLVFHPDEISPMR